MATILVVNPNSSQACSEAIQTAIAPLRRPGGPVIEVVTSAGGPEAIYSWRDWHAAVEPMCQIVETRPADAVVIACASDPGLEAVQALTSKPVFGIFRSAVALALARANRFGVIALADASVARHALTLRSMGVEARLVHEVPLNVPMNTLLDPHAARGLLLAAAHVIGKRGAQAIILGCTGMAAHRAAIEAACGVPVIEPCHAGLALALASLGDPAPTSALEPVNARREATGGFDFRTLWPG